jgi:hypothetical protein
MHRIIITLILAIVTAFAWQIGQRISTDAIMLAMGLLFGMMVGIPAMLVSSRNRPTPTNHYHMTTNHSHNQVVVQQQPKQLQPVARQLLSDGGKKR